MFSKLVFFTSILSPAVIAATFQITCNLDGITGSDQCLPFVDAFCDDAGMASTPLRIGDSTNRCFNTANGNRCDFTSFNSFVSERSGVADNCKSTLRQVISQCPMGGSSFVPPNKSFTWTVDPNVGKCSTGVQGGS